MKRSEGQWQGHEDLKAKTKRVVFLLEKRFGTPQGKKRTDPLDVLIETILSQNTNDRNRERAWQRLKVRFPCWEDACRAKTQTLVSAIRPGGLALQKARWIKGILHWVKKREGRMSLSFLEKLDSEEVAKVIGGLKGIGPKTFHCLLLFGLGRDAFPIDTHILRVGKRLGMIPVKMMASEAHQWMAPLVPQGKSLSFHLNLIRFGRATCKAQRPRCKDCYLEIMCLHHSQ